MQAEQILARWQQQLEKKIAEIEQKDITIDADYLHKLMDWLAAAEDGSLEAVKRQFFVDKFIILHEKQIEAKRQANLGVPIETERDKQIDELFDGCLGDIDKIKKLRNEI
jgi:hypothetical protein